LFNPQAVALIILLVDKEISGSILNFCIGGNLGATSPHILAQILECESQTIQIEFLISSYVVDEYESKKTVIFSPL